MRGLCFASVTAGYHHPRAVLFEVSLVVGPGEIVALLGPNGAGKTTTLRTGSGLLRPWDGAVTLNGQPIQGKSPSAIVKAGMAHVPEGRRILPGLTVAENLAMGGYTVRKQADLRIARERVLAMFPALRRRLRQAGGTLSGGEQQMLAIARALMSLPTILLVDELSMGLAPAVLDVILDQLRTLRQEGVGVLLVEQNVGVALRIAERAYLLERGRVTVSGPTAMVMASARMIEAYMGNQAQRQQVPNVSPSVNGPQITKNVSL